MKVRNTGVENWTDAPKIKIGICAMGKKTTSKECIIIIFIPGQISMDHGPIDCVRHLKECRRSMIPSLGHIELDYCPD